MKKGKRSAGWQEEDRGPGQKIELDLSDDEVEGIIDLDDILEVDDEGLLEDEDQLDLDVEILDADADLDADDLDAGLSDEDEEDILEDDFLKDFSPTREETLADREEEETLLDEGEDEDTLDFESLLRMEIEEEDVPTGDAPPLEADAAEAAGVALPAGVESLGEDDPPSLEHFVARIEERLIDAVRQVVEERLPEIVRSLLEEQIEKLKADR
ncbi:MAG: hypothetical protein MUF52_09235 [Syntrophobacteraceae bacterium]|jgi:hypothetical protein|nr:hypothetical protein [Syntrophobacteraceae bacterium]